MNKIDTILREAKSKIITRKDFDSLASKYNFNKFTLRRVMLNKGYLVTIFRGVYYLKSYEEKNKCLFISKNIRSQRSPGGLGFASFP
jgi:hypothetical protein